MKLGYPCINWSLPHRANRTFRLASFTPERFRQTVGENLLGLSKILEWNVNKGLLYFRIGSEIIPFASHPVCTVDWQEEFSTQLKKIGKYVNKNRLRIAMHPDQFVLINSPTAEIVKNSLKELSYHAELMDIMGLDQSAKIQIHVGGGYGNKKASVDRFVRVYQKLPQAVKRRLVIENDDRLYSLEDCLKIREQTGVPILLDVFHHGLLNQGETLTEAMDLAEKTWKKEDGMPLVDYSTQEPGGRRGKHAATIDLKHFGQFMREVKEFDFDLMLEIKDKEKSALRVVGM